MESANTIETSSCANCSSWHRCVSTPAPRPITPIAADDTDFSSDERKSDKRSNSEFCSGINNWLLTGLR